MTCIDVRRPATDRYAGAARVTLDPMIVAFSISPSGADETGGVSAAVAEAVRVVRASGLPNETNAMFTNIEGEWDEVMAVVKQAVDAVAAVSPRVSLVLKADIRPGFTAQLTAKVQRIDDALA
ncbi:S-adenosyl-L-methionine-dependent methyl transferase [Mycolicibacterium gilvum]|uniref:S-adenosyl-L-methionine-dependent methyl transferase n=2 Tax=Mycolicibacterium gilvum TaxID=1804 RepID=A0A378SGI7_9MYCO|nr:S-adenosyl-L-methionine-dependent methyl transferase [Mycolicibacterium gilvum]